jgi:hypothetical protein
LLTLHSKISDDQQDPDSKIDDSILSAIINSKKNQSKTQNESENLSSLLKIALAWNRADLAEKYILNYNLTPGDMEIIQSFMFDAINGNKIEFIKLFTDLGIKIENFFTYKFLLKLYNNVIITYFC